MKVHLGNNWSLVGGLLLGLLLSCDANAQSFLDKLEEAVRNRLSQPTQVEESEAEELPPPNRDEKNSERPAVSETEFPENRSSADVPRRSEGASGGEIYLGLEAEETIDGRLGVRVLSVTRQSPAWKAGFEVGDRILAVNGFAISNLQNLVEELGKTRPGDSARFLVNRVGRNIELTAVLVDAELAAALTPSVPSFAPSVAEANGIGGRTPARSNGPVYLGLRVNDLTSAFRQQFGISVFRGAAVSEVAKGSPAYRAGIRAGDAVVEADGVPIESANDLLRWVSSAKPGQVVELVVYRGGFSKALEVVLSEDVRGVSSNSDPIRRLRLSPSIVAAPDTNRPQALPPNSQADTPAFEAGPSRVVDPSAAEESGEDAAIVPPPVEPRISVRNDGVNDELPQESLLAEIAQLERENAELRSVLAETEARLEATEAKLTQILKLLQESR
jgi:membrane-associated protease RseP (regulator of RpoE activity)